MSTAGHVHSEMTADGQRIAAVSERHRFNEAALDRWLRVHVEEYAGGLEVSQFAGGASNPTFLLTCGERRYVLRKKPPGALLSSAHQVEREYRVMTALRESEVPVPVTRGLCEDAAVIGTPFYIMDFLEGRILRNAALPGMTSTERAAIYDEFNRVLARLHRVDWQAVGLGDFGRPGNFFERQIARWSRQYRDTPLPSVPAMDQLIEELQHSIPADNSVAIAHGDFRLENMMFHPTEPRLVAVLDWELSTIGHPLADLGYSGYLWHSHSPNWGTLDGVDFQCSGIPSERQWIESYCRRTGRDSVDGWSFLLAFSVFRLAAITHGVYARALAGTTPMQDGLDVGCRQLAEQALELLHRSG